MEKLATIGVFGGSGFYKFLDNIEELTIDTPYGKTSDALMLGTIAGKKVAFMPRHGRNHSIAPHKVNYRANVWAMKEIGCKRVISPCAAGSLQEHVKPGDIVFYTIASETMVPFFRQGFVVVNENRIMAVVNEKLTKRRDELKSK